MYATDRWAVARFPNRALRDEFLGQIRLWNSLEDVPKIGTELLNDGIGVKLHSRGTWSRHLDRLVDSFGGRIEDRAADRLSA
jgi:hypothetical protein